MLRKTTFLLLALSMVLLLLTINVYAQDGATATTRAQLNIRTAPGISSLRIGSLAPNSVVILEARNDFGDWVLIRSDQHNLRGWASAAYLNLSVNVTSLPVSSERIDAGSGGLGSLAGATCATTTVLNLRTAPSTSGRILTSLPNNTGLILEGRNESGTWALVKTIDGTARGWVFTRFLVVMTGGTVMDAPVASLSAETFYNGQVVTTEPTTPTTPTDSTTTVSYVPEGNSVWQANSGTDNTSGTCNFSPLVVCNHLVAITLNSNGSISWRGQEPTAYTLRKVGTNTYSFSGRNKLNNADITLYLTFNSTSSWSMTMRQVFDNDPGCTHTFYYTATRNW